MLKKFKIGDSIGPDFEVYDIFEGGMGIVYVCFHKELKILLALKTFKDRIFNSDEIKESFKGEALIWIGLERHPNIVNAGTFEFIDDVPFIYLEFIAPDQENRKTLDDYIRTELSKTQILDWAIQFCYGMEHAKSHNVSPHRDIKPANIMITREDKLVKITDFGLAKLWDKSHLSISDDDINDPTQLTIFNNTNGKFTSGTPPWMAPEQFDGIADERSDIYSFGVTLYQMANKGKNPFNATTFDEWEIAHKNTELPVIDTEIFPILKKCLNKNPQDRYNDFRELRTDLEKYYKETGNEPYSPESIDLSVDTIIGKAYGLQNLGFFEDAFSEYQKAVNINSKSFLARINTGAGFNRLHKYDEAISEFSKAVELEPNNARHIII